VVGDTRSVVLAGLADAGPASLSSLAASLGLSTDRLGEQVELATSLESLEADGLVEIDADGEVRCRLTEAGRAAATDAREALLSARVELVAEDREEVTVADAARRLDRPPTAVATAATDGVLYGEETPGRSFVGRESVRSTAEEALGTAREGSGRGLLLSGPPGVGKTALAERVVADLVDDETVLRARAQGAGARSYQVLRDALSQVSADPFAEGGPSADDPDALRAQQQSLFREVTAALVPGDGSARVLFLDDLHLADPGTVAYLEHLFDTVGEHPLFVLGNYRPSELPDDSPLSGAIEASPAVTQCRLSPLDRERTARLIEGVLETYDPPETFVDAVHERTGGTPLFVEETVAALRESGALDPDLGVYPDADAIDVPGEVRETIDHRVAQFPASARDLLRWAGVLGERFPAAVLRSVADLPEEQVRTYVEAFVEGGVLDRDGDHLAFRSEVVREALLADLTDDQRRDRHERIARALSEFEDTDPARLAHHRERAGDHQAAVEAYRAAADEARDVYAHETALEHLEAALDLAREAAPAAIVDLALETALVHRTVANYDAAERFARFAREQAETTDERRRALARLGDAAHQRGDHARAPELVEEGLSLDGDRDSMASLLQNKVAALSDLGRYDETIETARRYREVAKTLEDDRRQVAALRMHADAMRDRGDYERARELYETALPIVETADLRLQEATVRNGLGRTLARLGDLDGAVEQYEAALALFDDAGAGHDAATGHTNTGLVARRLGQLDRAREHHEHALSVNRRAGDRTGTGKALNNLGLVAYRQGELDRAVERFEAALDIFEELDARRAIAEAHSNLGTIAMERGDLETAVDRLETALSEYRAIGAQHGIAAARGNLGLVARQRGDYETAREHLQATLDIHRELGARHGLANSLHGLGSIASAEGDHETARERFVEAAETFTEVGADAKAAEAHRWAAAEAHELGATGDARERLATARATAETLDDDTLSVAVLATSARVALDAGDSEAGRAHGEAATGHLAGASVGGSEIDVVGALRELVAAAADAGHDTVAREWCDRVLADLDVPPAALEWFEQRREAAADD